VKADRTVIVFGVFLFLIGLAAAWNGYGYVELERGWSMVISGTVGFCTGLILIALGLILRQLKIASTSAAQSALFLAKASHNGAAPVAPAPDDEGVLARHPAQAPGEALAEEAAREEAREPVQGAAQGFSQTPSQAPSEFYAWDEAEAAAVATAPAQVEENYASKPPAWMTRASSYAAAFGAARATEPAAAEIEPFAEDHRQQFENAVADEVDAHEARPQGAFLRDAFAQETHPQETHPQETLHEETLHEETLDEGALREGAFPDDFFRHETSVVEEVETEGAPASPAPSRLPRWETAIEDLIAEETPEQIEAPAHEPAARIEPEQSQAPTTEAPADFHEHPAAAHEQPAEEAPSAETPAILGQYEAHGARYTMYVDGSIDAETAHGVYHFVSMEELKRFIEQGA
jgi:hypothetical protein